MSIVLILREEIVCIVILAFFMVYSRLYSRADECRSFMRISGYALAHVILDLVTVITVNHTDSVPEAVNCLLHYAFYIFAVLFCFEYFSYTVRITQTAAKAKKIIKITSLLPLMYFVFLPFANIEYLYGGDTYYSMGTSVYIGYGLAVLLFAASTANLLANIKRIEKIVLITVVPMDIIMISALVLQVIFPELLLTGACVTIVTVGVYFAIDNPAEKFRQHAYIDINTGVKNKNCFEEDIRRLDKKYFGTASRSDTPLGIVVCDLNGLKSVNDVYGHIAGDELIRSAAEVLSDTMRSAKNIYRIGGDEFVALYIGASSDLMEKEISGMKKECTERSKKSRYPLSIAAGCAVSESGCPSVNDVISSADKRMYTDKVMMKEQNPTVSIRR